MGRSPLWSGIQVLLPLGLLGGHIQGLTQLIGVGALPLGP